MPITKERQKLYPQNWPEIRQRIRERAGYRCEGTPQYPNCRAEHGKPHPVTGSKVVCTVSHINHNPKDCRLSNLRLNCQRCHLSWDAWIHARNRRQHVLAASREGESLALPLEER